MKFCWTTIHVKDMDKSLAFYQEIVGLPLVRRAKASPEMELAFLGSGETQVELICDGKPQAVKHGDSISMGFRADSLETIIETLKAKQVPGLTGIIQPNPGIRFLYVLDPDGVKIQFVEFAK